MRIICHVWPSSMEPVSSPCSQNTAHDPQVPQLVHGIRRCQTITQQLSCNSTQCLKMCSLGNFCEGRGVMVWQGLFPEFQKFPRRDPCPDNPEWAWGTVGVLLMCYFVYKVITNKVFKSATCQLLSWWIPFPQWKQTSTENSNFLSYTPPKLQCRDCLVINRDRAVLSLCMGLSSAGRVKGVRWGVAGIPFDAPDYRPPLSLIIGSNNTFHQSVVIFLSCFLFRPLGITQPSHLRVIILIHISIEKSVHFVMHSTRTVLRKKQSR